jgi:endonuclease/exonuclease/phosphatase family metal-dependent hydrolase
MRIMTFNIRFENDRDVENHWSLRRDLLIEVIQRHGPAVLGTQEGTLSQLAYIGERLPDYAVHAPRRVLDSTCQYPTLFYRQDQLQILEGAEFWLSTTPGLHRSKDWDSAFPRMMSYALFAVREQKIPIWVAVTHLDHVGHVARLKQAEIIVGWVKERSGPLILMGDFNDVPGSELHRSLAAPETGLRDSWELLELAENDSSMTHHGFDGKPQKGRLDWILISRHFKVCQACIVRDHERGRYPSDHFPYCVDLQWNDA